MLENEVIKSENICFMDNLHLMVTLIGKKFFRNPYWRKTERK